MKGKLIVGVVVLAVLAGLGMAAKLRAPKPAVPTTKEIWAKSGIPIKTATIGLGDMKQAVEVTGDITALDQVTLSPKIAGRLAAVYVREGDSVSAGQVIAMLDQDDAKRSLDSAKEGLQAALARLSQAKTTAKVTKIQTDAAIAQAKSQLESAKARLAVAKNPARNQDKLVAENRVAAAKANLDNKEADYRRNKTLLDKGAISESTFDLAKTQYTIAQTDYESAKQQLALIVEGGRSEDITTAEAGVESAKEMLRTAESNAAQNMLREEDTKSAAAAVGQAKAAVALAQQQLSYTYVKSPISGQIASRTADPGQVVAPGQAVVTVVNVGSVYFKGDVSEKEVVNISPGQQVRVNIDAMKGRDFAGTVAEVYPSGSSTSRNFSVRIAITGKSPEIKPGMFARGEIITGVDRGILMIPKDAVDSRGGTSMVFVIDSKNQAKREDVEVINEDNQFVEIASPNNLKAGDVLATQGRQNLQDKSKVSVDEK